MSRAAAKGETPTGRATLDGVEYVSISIIKHSVFARACVDAWSKADGTSRHYLLKHAKAVWVPASVLEAARQSLGPKQTPEEYAE